MGEARDGKVAGVGRLQALLARNADADLGGQGKGELVVSGAHKGRGKGDTSGRTSASLIMPTSLAPSPMARVSGSGDTLRLTQPTRCRFCCGLARQAMTADRPPMMAANRRARRSSPNSTAMQGPSMAMATPMRDSTRPRARAAACVGERIAASPCAGAPSPPPATPAPSFGASAARAAASLAASTSLVRRECSAAVSRSSSASLASTCATKRLRSLESPRMPLSARSRLPSAPAAPASVDSTPSPARTGGGAAAASPCSSAPPSPSGGEAEVALAASRVSESFTFASASPPGRGFAALRASAAAIRTRVMSRPIRRLDWPMLTAVSILSPVRTQTLMPARRSAKIVLGTFSCSLSSMPVHPRSL